MMPLEAWLAALCVDSRSCFNFSTHDKNPMFAVPRRFVTCLRLSLLSSFRRGAVVEDWDQEVARRDYGVV